MYHVLATHAVYFFAWSFCKLICVLESISSPVGFILQEFSTLPGLPFLVYLKAPSLRNPRHLLLSVKLSLMENEYVGAISLGDGYFYVRKKRSHLIVYVILYYVHHFTFGADHSHFS